MVFESELILEREAGVAVVTLNRPQVHNALNATLLGALGETIDDLSADSTVNAVVLTGAGERSFCAGADLEELGGLDARAAREHLRAGQAVMTRVASSRVPVISAVNGHALGGGFELVLATTFPVLSERASFGLPESGLGLIPGYGGTQRLPRLVGRACAAHVMLTGERLEARRAYELGLSPLPPVAPGELLEVALRTARTIAARGPWATAAILEALMTSSPAPALLDLESALAGVATASAEAAEGIAAFTERRSPVFAPRHDDSSY